MIIVREWDLKKHESLRMELLALDRKTTAFSNYKIGDKIISDALYSAWIHEQITTLDGVTKKYIPNDYVGPLSQEFIDLSDNGSDNLFDDFLEEYYKVPKELFEMILPVTSIMAEIGYNANTEQGGFFKTKKFNINECMFLYEKIFKSFGDEAIYSKFRELTDPNNKRLFIYRTPRNNIHDGANFLDTFHHKGYISLNLTNSVLDFFAIGADLLHMCLREDVARTDYDIREEKYLNYLERHFFTLAATDFLRSTAGWNEHVTEHEQAVYKDKMDFAFEILYASELANCKVPEAMTNYLRNIKKTLGIWWVPPLPDFDTLIDSEMFSFRMESLTSYLAALDVYELYQSDRESAIDVLKECAASINPTDSTLIEIGTTFHKDGYQNMTRMGKRLLKNNTN